MRLHGLTAPDHTPYLLPTDLRTAEDAAAFVRTYVVDPATEWDLSDVYNYLERRLDRERRQACRRGARRTFADAAELMRGYALEQKCGVVRDTGIEYAIGHYLTRALAFRAAARS